jgi:hypothetical protein
VPEVGGSDVEAARDELLKRGAKVSEIFHFEAGRQVVGPDSHRSSYGSFVSLKDPDGNAWMVQEVRRSEPPAKTR